MVCQRLVGKAALVTGGGGEIGKTICEVFAREGAYVAVVDINTTGLENTFKLLTSEHGNTHCMIEADVTSYNDVRRALNTAEKKFGMKISILVNCAGIIGAFDYIDKIEERIFDDVMRINLKSMFITTKEFLSALKNSTEKKQGSIVNMASVAGIKGTEKLAPYSSSKFAVVDFTKTVAQEYSNHRVRCNAIAPGPILTQMLESVPKETRVSCTEIPMGKYGRTEEVANVCLFLVSDESSYVNGACITVDGGYSC